MIIFGFLPGVLRVRAVAAGSGMAGPVWRGRRAAGDGFGLPGDVRRGVCRCLLRRAGALLELGGALRAAGRVVSLPCLGGELVFRRGRGMVGQGLARGRVGEDALRDLLVASGLADWPCVPGVDAPATGRPAAVTSAGRESHHHSCAGHAGAGDPVIRGRAWQWLSSAQPRRRVAGRAAGCRPGRPGWRGGGGTGPRARGLAAGARRDADPAVGDGRRVRRGARHPGACAITPGQVQVLVRAATTG
jgi:hypothetical protein